MMARSYERELATFGMVALRENVESAYSDRCAPFSFDNPTVWPHCRRGLAIASCVAGCKGLNAVECDVNLVWM